MHRLFVTLLILAAPILATKFSSASSATAAEREQFAKLLKGTNNTNNNVKSTSIPYIIGGAPANKTEFPWFGRTLVSFLKLPDFFGGLDIRSFTCGASLIHRDIAVSAASCFVYPYYNLPGYLWDMEFFLGAKNYNGSDGIKFIVETVYWPDGYDYTDITSGSDIVFYKLSKSTNVTPASWNTDPLIPRAGDIGTAIGFGSTTDNGQGSQILLKVNLPAISNEQCDNFYIDDVLPASVTCTYVQNRSTCQGDSGGPIVTQKGDIYGISSYVGCSQGPSYYTRTSSFRELIPQVICNESSYPPFPCVGVPTPAPVLVPVKAPVPVPVTAPVKTMPAPVKAPVPVNVPVPAPVLVPVKAPVPVPVTAPVKTMPAPVKAPVPVSAPIPVTTPVVDPIPAPVPVKAPSPVPTLSPVDDSCGIFGIFCLFQTCGFFARLFNIGSC